MAFREVKLPSGAVLKVAPGSFSESKALYQVVMEEMKGVGFGKDVEITVVIKDLFCIGVSSKKIEAALEVCFPRCVYCGPKGDLKIDKDTFEPVDARQDYMTVCLEVVKENVLPFVKSLYAEYLRAFQMIESSPA